tara:strand:- start:882 stop:1367 length:486 start_codon:yes stop_codon:yes gene_type:complete
MIKISFDSKRFNANVDEMFRKWKKRNARAMKKGTKSAAGTAYLMVFQSLSGPYSLSALKRMGHPYSKLRYSSINVPGIEPHVVNVQSGDLRSSLKIKEGSSSEGGSSWSVGFDKSAPYYLPYIIEGTYKMHSRDVIGRTLNNPIAYKKMLQSFLTVYRRHI